MKRALLRLYWQAFSDGQLVENRKIKPNYLRDPYWIQRREDVIKEARDRISDLRHHVQKEASDEY